MPSSTDAEVLDGALLDRVSKDLTSAVRRRPASEDHLAAALRLLAPQSPRLRDQLTDALPTLVKRGAWERRLTQGALRSLAQAGDKRVLPFLVEGLKNKEPPNLACLSAAGFLKDAQLKEPLARIVIGRQSQLGFAAEVARVARGESNGAPLYNVAPKIKEAHRIALCLEVFLPLLQGPKLAPSVAPALRVLRDSERHLGRWLVLAEVSVRGGDSLPQEEADRKVSDSAGATKTAWSLVRWALSEGEPPPPLRPTMDLVTRLSDRPSATKDMTFLFRLADAGSTHIRPILETICRGAKAPTATSLRAHFYLARDHQRGEAQEEITRHLDGKSSPLSGLACALLWDLGKQAEARKLAQGMLSDKYLPNACWAGLVLAAESEKGPAVTSERYRRLVDAWLE